MRRPRDVERYKPAAEVAADLRRVADDLEEDADAYPLVKVQVELWFWNPEWASTPSRRPA